MKDPVIVIESDALPIVRVIAIFLENAARNPGIADRMTKLEGTIAFRSSVDKQAASVHFKLGNIRVERGIAGNASITAELDLNQQISLGSEITLYGDLEHPEFASSVRGIFTWHATDWIDAARDFWGLYGSRDDLPDVLHAQCTDDSREITLGEGSTRMHLVGSANALASVFSCSTMLARSVITGEIRAVGQLKYLSTLSGVYFDRITGVAP